MENKLDYSDIYGTRVLIFLEVEPQSNKYVQVLLSSEMYKEITAKLGKKVKDGKTEIWAIKTSEKEYTLPDLHEAVSNYDDL